MLEPLLNQSKLSVQILSLEIHSLNHYSTVASAIIDINCKNQLS